MLQVDGTDDQYYTKHLIPRAIVCEPKLRSGVLF